MIAALASISPWVLLTSGLFFRVQLTKVAFRPAKSWSMALRLDNPPQRYAKADPGPRHQSVTASRTAGPPIRVTLLE